MINSDEKNAAVANKKSMIDELQSKIAHEAKSNADELQSKIPDKSKTQPPSYGKSYGSQITSLKSMWENMNKPLDRSVDNTLTDDDILEQITGLMRPHIVGQIEQDVNIDFKYLGSDGEGKHALAARLACTRVYKNHHVRHLRHMGEIAHAFLKSKVYETPVLERRVVLSPPGHIGVLKLCKEDEDKLCYVDANGILNDGQEMLWTETPFPTRAYEE